MQFDILRKFLGFICLFIAVLFFINITSYPASLTDTHTTSENPNVSSEYENQQADAKVNTYILREYKNSIGIFREGDTIPFRTIDTDLRALPELDKQMLTSGIRISGENDLKHIIQDYES